MILKDNHYIIDYESYLSGERERERGQTGVVDVGAADKEPLALNGAGFEAEGGGAVESVWDGQQDQMDTNEENGGGSKGKSKGKAK